MSTEQRQNRCTHGLNRMWTNLRHFFTRLAFYYNRHRRVRMEHDGDSVTLVRITNATTQAVANANWRDTLLDANRVPPRKRYHQDRSPDTLLQIKIALEEQVIKDMIAEESRQKSSSLAETAMESGESIKNKEVRKIKVLHIGEEKIRNNNDTDKSN